jgi:hypothetical protein
VKFVSTRGPALPTQFGVRLPMCGPAAAVFLHSVDRWGPSSFPHKETTHTKAFVYTAAFTEDLER